MLMPGSGEEYGEIAEEDVPINTKTAASCESVCVSKVAQDLIGFVCFKSYGTKVFELVRSIMKDRAVKMCLSLWYAYQIARSKREARQTYGSRLLRRSTQFTRIDIVKPTGLL